MNMNFNLNLTQEQKLVMTQQMQLSIKLLQMSSIELQEHVEQEVQENPVLEFTYSEDNEDEKVKSRIDYKELAKYLDFDKYGQRHYEKSDEEEVSPFNFVSIQKSLKQYLLEQIIDLDVKGYLVPVSEYIIENLDDRGYLEVSVKDMAEQLKLDETVVLKVLEQVQSLDPAGIAARDLKECLRIQLERKGINNKDLYFIVENHLEDIGDNRYSAIAKSLGIEMKEAQRYGDIIKTLQPRPSSGFYTGEEVRYIAPDAYIREIGSEYHIVMNENLIPKLNINEIYKEILKDEKDEAAVEYVKEKINNALFLMKSIEHRKSTIYKVLEKIVEIQKDYFKLGESYLKPMTLKDISESISMHESTVSRAIKDKYVNTKRGTIKIKDLFTVGLTSANNEEDVSTSIIKKEIKTLIDKEDKAKPLSDQAICDYLNEKGMNISRRTVAKYREELNIKASSKRKRF
jgi:RNA polymerase sigma-54 factor